MRDNRLKVVPLFVSIKSALFVDTHIKKMTQSMKMADFMDLCGKNQAFVWGMDIKQKHLLIEKVYEV